MIDEVDRSFVGWLAVLHGAVLGLITWVLLRIIERSNRK